MKYLKRVVEDEVQESLAFAGAVLIEGPRGVGKTSTGTLLSKSTVRLDVDTPALDLARVAPELVLRGDVPRLIDEWQLADGIWNQVRHQVDQRGKPGQFILTGSASRQALGDRHPGTGRIARVTMRPMSLWEQGLSNGQVSLQSLLRGQEVQGIYDFNIDVAIQAICRGGFPAAVDLGFPSAQKLMKAYLDDVVNIDFSNLTGQKRNSRRLHNLIRGLARNVGSEISTAKLANEVGSTEGLPIKPETLEGYLEVLRQMFLVDDLRPWAPQLRSSYVVRKAWKRYLVDPSLAAAALGADPASLLGDLETTGFLFENMAVRDLRVYAQAMGCEVSHYRDSGGLEVDAIVEKTDGTWGAFEVKLSPTSVEKAAVTLKKLEQQLDYTKSKKPSFLAVLTTGTYSYVRPDGVAVVNIGTLGP